MPAKTKTSASASAAAPAKPVVAAPNSSQIGVSNSNLDQAQVLKAFKALAAHIARRNNTNAASNSSNSLPLDGPSGNLRDPSNSVYVQITINTLSPTSHVKPVRINLPHALHNPGEVSTCLLVKDPQREYKDLLVDEKIKCISRVVGVTKLKGKFKPFDARRALVQDHDLFLADARIVPNLPNLCGKVFFDAKKNPITVDIQKKGEALKKELESAISATTFLQNKGSCNTLKIGYLASHSPEQLTENLMSALPAVLSKIKGGWENVHNIDVKTGNSAALPVWNAKLGVKTHVSSTPSKLTQDTTTTSSSPAASGSGSSKKDKKRPAPAAARNDDDDEEDEIVMETPSKKKPTLAKSSSASSTPAKSTPAKAAKTSATPAKSATPAGGVAVASPQIKKVQIEDASTPKKPSPRKTRSAAANAKAGLSIDQANASTPIKSSSATPRKVASSVSRSARKVK